MKRLVSLFLIVLALHIIYGLYISYWNPQVFPSGLSTKIPGQQTFFDYSGAINVKSNRSTGSGSYSDITAAANSTQIDFIVFCEVNDFVPALDREGYLNNVLVLMGGDYGSLEGRILNFDIHKLEHLQGPGRTQSAFADLLSEENDTKAEGIFVLAHPYKPGYNTNSPIPIGIDGVEIMDLKDVWQQAWFRSQPSFFWNMITYPFNSKLSYLRMLSLYGAKELSLWDKLNQTRSVYGYFGSAAEANARITKKFSLSFPSYETIFSIVRNHVLLKSELVGNSDLDRKKISTALRNGQFYMSIDILQDPRGFLAYIQNKGGQIIPIGAQISFEPELELVVKLPDKPLLNFEIVLIKDGEKVVSSNSDTATYSLHGPGVYRVMVRLKVPFPFPERSRWLNWIVTNPFYVR